MDNAAYYRLSPEDPRYYMDFTGCGNTLNMSHPRILQLIMDSLRYWVTEMHVDGFRFDLASTLARELYEVNRLGAFFDIIHQDPVLSQVKLIAEPWDVGPGGYRWATSPWAGPSGTACTAIASARFWKGDGGADSRAGHPADRIERPVPGRRPKAYASINFITCHDGFTLQDLVTYNEKHNEANGEENRDGANDNESWNCGVEGPSDDPKINALRDRQMRRNFVATLLFSQGVPMLLAGDEMGHSQERQQQRLLPGQRADLAQLGPGRRAEGVLDFIKKLTQSGAVSRCSKAEVLPGAADPRLGRQGHLPCSIPTAAR